MTIEERLNLIEQVGEEIVTKEELKKLLESGEPLIAYDGFEPSGKIHIAQGLLRAINVNKMTRAGVKFKMWVADWHALANNKMGGDLDKIRTVGRYFIEVWKASGMDLKNVEFIWASDFINQHAADYWLTVLKIAKENSVQRIIRCAQIMGRSESERLTAAQIIYPCMQASDIFFLKANITQLGLDQRKVNMMAREVGEKIGFWKPVVISHHMLMGLSKPETAEKDPFERTIKLKMSKSLPDTSIFMTDTPAEVERKITKAYCPPAQTKDNPILDYCRYILFEKFKSLSVKRSLPHGGDLKVDTYAQLESLYLQKKIHPQDLKKAVALSLNELLEPVRRYFKENLAAKKLKGEVESFAATR